MAIEATTPRRVISPAYRAVQLFLGGTHDGLAATGLDPKKLIGVGMGLKPDRRIHRDAHQCDLEVSPSMVRVGPTRRDELLNAAVAVRTVHPDTDGWLRIEVTFQDLCHAEWALWQLDTDAEVISPESLRAALRDRATTIAAHYGKFR